MRTRTALTAAAAAALIVVGTAGTAAAGGHPGNETNVKTSEKTDIKTAEKNGPVAAADADQFSGALGGKIAASVANQQVVNGFDSPFTNATQANPVVVFSPLFVD